MKHATKAALISGLIFPGTGHLYLKKYIPGAVLLIAAFFCAYLITIEAIESAQQIVNKIQSSSGQADINALLKMVEKQQAENSSYLSDLPTTLFAIFWLVGVIDAYRLGRAQDKIDNVQTDKTG